MGSTSLPIPPPEVVVNSQRTNKDNREAKPRIQTRLGIRLKENTLCERQRLRTELETKRVREREFARYEVTTMCDNPNLN